MLRPDSDEDISEDRSQLSTNLKADDAIAGISFYQGLGCLTIKQKNMILITGATGFLGAAIVENLLKTLEPKELAIYARNAAKAKKWKDLGLSVRIGDFKNVEALKAGMREITKIVLIPTSDKDSFNQHKNVIDVSTQAKINHLFYVGGAINHNVRATRLGPLKDAYFATENYIRQSGIAYTMIQNGFYAEVIPFFVGERLPVNSVIFPSGEGKASFAKREEMGEAIANIILMGQKVNASYTLTGNHAYSFGEIAEILGELTGKKIGFENPQPKDFVKQLRQYGIDKQHASIAAHFAALIKNNEFSICDSTLEQVLGRTPTSLKDYLADQYLK